MKHNKPKQKNTGPVRVSRRWFESLIRAENVARAYREAATAPVMSDSTPGKWNDAIGALKCWLRAAGKKERCKPPAVNRDWIE